MDREQYIEALNELQKRNKELQTIAGFGSRQWHLHETIDDKLHDLLTISGE